MFARGKALARQAANIKFRCSLKCYICITSLFIASTSPALGKCHIHLQSHQDPLISQILTAKCNNKEPHLGDKPHVTCQTMRSIDYVHGGMTELGRKA